MSKGGKKTTVAQTSTAAPDAASQAYIDQMRQQAQNASGVALNGPPGGGSFFTGPLTQTPGQMAQPFMNAYTDNVVNGVRGEFDNLRGQASVAANQQATAGGAFGGSRHAVMQGARLGEIDRAQGSTISNILNSGYQNALQQGTQFAQYNQGLEAQQRMEPLWRQQQAQGMVNLGLGPVGMNGTNTSNTTEKGSATPWGDAIGMGLSAFGLYQGMKGGGGRASGGGPPGASGYGYGGPMQGPPGTVPYRPSMYGQPGLFG